MRPPEFQGLVRTMRLVVQHADYPGKQAAVEQCLEEIEEFYRQGRLTAEQRAELVGVGAEACRGARL